MSDEEKRGAERAGAIAARIPATPVGMKRIRLVRSIVLGGEHAETDSIHDVGRALAHRLIGEGSAIQHVEQGESPDAPAVTVNRMENPINGDPKPVRISGPKPSVRDKK